MVETSEGKVNLPVYEPSDIGEGVYDVVRVMTDGGAGVIPFSDPGDAAYEFLRVMTESNGVLAASDSASLQQFMYIDNFEDGDLSEYFAPSGYAMDNFSVSSNQVFDGNYSLEANYIYDTNTSRVAVSTSGLSNYPSKGDVFSFWYRANGSYGEKPNFYFNRIDADNTYFVNINQSNGGPNYEKVRIFRIKNGSGTVIASSGGNGSADLPGQEWHRFEVHWNPDDTFDFYVYDEQGNLEASGSGSDNSPLEDSNGIGFNANGDSAYGAGTDKIWFDYGRIHYTVIENFETGDISEYSGNTGSYSVNSGGIDGSYYLQTNSNNTVIKSLPGDGLPYYPSRGDIFEWWAYENGNGNAVETWFGAQDYSGTGGGYNAAVVTSTGGETQMRLGTYGGVGDDVTSPRTINGAEKEWLRCRLEWADPKLKFKVYDRDGNLYGEISGEDTQFDSGGIGFDTSWSNNSNSEPYDQRWDYIRKVGEI